MKMLVTIPQLFPQKHAAGHDSSTVTGPMESPSDMRGHRCTTYANIFW